MDKMKAIEGQADKFSQSRSTLLGLINTLDDAIEQLKREAMPAIRKQARKAADEHKALAHLVADAPELFVKPRTAVMHGIKLGFKKGAGKVSFADEERVIELIRKKLPDQAEQLIETSFSLKKTALSGLEIKALAAIGCTVEGTGDVVVVAPAGSDVFKLVAALIKGRQDEEQAV